MTRPRRSDSPFDTAIVLRETCGALALDAAQRRLSAAAPASREFWREVVAYLT